MYIFQFIPALLKGLLALWRQWFRYRYINFRCRQKFRFTTSCEFINQCLPCVQFSFITHENFFNTHAVFVIKLNRTHGSFTNHHCCSDSMMPVMQEKTQIQPAHIQRQPCTRSQRYMFINTDFFMYCGIITHHTQNFSQGFQLKYQIANPAAQINRVRSICH